MINEKETIKEFVPWIIDEVDEKIQNALGTDHLNSIEIENLNSKSWVANEFLDLLTCYDIPAQGLNKLSLIWFDKNCEPFEDEVVSRLANLCPNLTYLALSHMAYLTEAGMLQIFNLFRQIIQNNPPIKDLCLYGFSGRDDIEENIGELVLETLLSSNIDSITELDLGNNKSWFWLDGNDEPRFSNVDYLNELVTKQVGIQTLGLRYNYFSQKATQSILTRIAEICSDSALQNLWLH